MGASALPAGASDVDACKSILPTGASVFPLVPLTAFENGSCSDLEVPAAADGACVPASGAVCCTANCNTENATDELLGSAAIKLDADGLSGVTVTAASGNPSCCSVAGA